MNSGTVETVPTVNGGNTTDKETHALQLLAKVKLSLDEDVLDSTWFLLFEWI